MCTIAAPRKKKCNIIRSQYVVHGWGLSCSACVHEMMIQMVMYLYDSEVLTIRCVFTVRKRKSMRQYHKPFFCPLELLLRFAFID
jgi:hypothetical protein